MARKKTKLDGIAYDDQRKRYYVYLYYGVDSNGKPIKRTKSTKTLKEAKQIRDEHRKARAADQVIIPVDDTLIKYANDYIDYKALSLAATTIYGYRNILNNHIALYFREQKIQDVTVRDLQNYVVEKAKTVSMNTVKKHMDLLYSIFQDACRKEIISKNPVAQMERISEKKKEISCYNAQEMTALIKHLEGHVLQLPVMLAACLGLRRGEVLGLKWDCIDFERSVLTIENTRTQAGAEKIEKGPKTEKSHRTLFFGEDISEALRKQKLWQEERRASKYYFEENDYVVTNLKGRPYSPNYLSDSFARYLEQNGFRHVRFHDLRHSFASIANDKGVAMNDISSAMGHSNIGVTSSIYTHEFSKVKSKATSAVAESLADQKTPISA